MKTSPTRLMTIVKMSPMSSSRFNPRVLGPAEFIFPSVQAPVRGMTPRQEKMGITASSSDAFRTDRSNRILYVQETEGSLGSAIVLLRAGHAGSEERLAVMEDRKPRLAGGSRLFFLDPGARKLLNPAATDAHHVVRVVVASRLAYFHRLDELVGADRLSPLHGDAITQGVCQAMKIPILCRARKW